MALAILATKYELNHELNEKEEKNKRSFFSKTKVAQISSKKAVIAIKAIVPHSQNQILIPPLSPSSKRNKINNHLKVNRQRFVYAMSERH